MHSAVPCAEPVAAIAAASHSCRGDPTARKMNRAGWSRTNATVSANATGSRSNAIGGSKCAGDARPNRAVSAGNQPRRQADDGNALLRTHKVSQQVRGQVAARRDWGHRQAGERGQRGDDARVQQAQFRVPVDAP